MGKHDASDDDIEVALKQSNALEFVTKLPDGINQCVGPDGSNLSGGQKQRIVLARALIKQPKLLILDEATTALDRASEFEIQKALDSLRKTTDFTTIIISNRISAVCNADRIIVIKEGRIVEDGMH